jgi:hypothetical protein
VIEKAHSGSILDFTYLQLSQLLISSSTDKSIKVWDPLGRPIPLNIPNDPKKELPQYTISNQPFNEIKKIYTSDEICYKLLSFKAKISTASLTGERKNTLQKHTYLEELITISLKNPVKINNQMRSP